MTYEVRETMPAAVHSRFGGPEVISVEQLPVPRPGDDEVLVRVIASTVSIADHRMRSRDLPDGLGFLGPISLGLLRPRHPVLGMDLAGVVEEVGTAVTRFRPGDEVIAMKGSAFGGHAGYATARAAGAIALKPRSLDFEQSVALVFGGLTAMEFLETADLQPGSRVLVNGASGAVGSAAVQLAKQRGAVVTGVTSEANLDLVRSLGADEVVDYRREDFATSDRAWDVIVECVGNAPFARVRDALAPGGTLLLVIADLRSMLTARRDSKRTGKRVVTSAPGNGAVYLERLAQLADQGELRPVIDRTYSLAQAVEAHRYVDSGRKRGSVVLRVG
jgi:NADPH:quinone reductase-like Zn-dependent oxidoreductase